MYGYWVPISEKLLFGAHFSNVDFESYVKLVMLMLEPHQHTVTFGEDKMSLESVFVTAIALLLVRSLYLNYHRRTQAPLRRVIVRSRSWLNYEGE